LVVIDPLKIRDLAPFWTALADGEHETIVHAGRQEIEFSLAAIGRPPRAVFDVQIAAGLIGLEYPASYGTLVSKLLGQTPPKRGHPRRLAAQAPIGKANRIRPGRRGPSGRTSRTTGPAPRAAQARSLVRH